MSTTHVSVDPDALTDTTPNLGAVTVVAAKRGISVPEARDQLLAEWDQRLVSRINSEADMAQNWLATARDHSIAGGPRDVGSGRDRCRRSTANSASTAPPCAA